jgi:hypothetical protein
MRYPLKSTTYAFVWCLAGAVLAYQFDDDLSWPALLVIGLGMAVVAALTSRWFFGQKL